MTALQILGTNRSMRRFFVARGQDVAQVINGSSGSADAGATGDDDLDVFVRLPNP